MKNNNILYLLLVVLILINGFFLFNYLGRTDHKGPKESGNFIVSELKFNETQLQQFEELETKHQNKMRAIGDGAKLLKDELFENITAQKVDQETIDNLIISISEKEILKEKELFNRLRGVYELCNDEQKEHFNDIIKKARRPEGSRPERPDRPRRQNKINIIES